MKSKECCFPVNGWQLLKESEGTKYYKRNKKISKLNKTKNFFDLSRIWKHGTYRNIYLVVSM